MRSATGVAAVVSVKDQLLAWVADYRAAKGEKRARLGMQVEAFKAAIDNQEDQVWLDSISEHLNTSVPLQMVARQADMAVAEYRSLTLGP